MFMCTNQKKMGNLKLILIGILRQCTVLGMELFYKTDNNNKKKEKKKNLGI